MNFRSLGAFDQLVNISVQINKISFKLNPKTGVFLLIPTFGAASIQGRRLFKGGLYPRKYGT